MSTYKTALSIVNEVHKRLFIDTVDDLDDTQFSELCLAALNDVVWDICDAGGLVDRRGSNEYALTSTGLVKVSASAGINRVEDVYYGDMELKFREPHEIRRRLKVSPDTQTATEYSIVNTSAGVVDIQIWGIPEVSASSTIDVAYYMEPPQYTSADSSTIVPYDANTVIAGVYANMILHETGDKGIQMRVSNYMQKKDRVLTKHTSETGTGVSFRY